MKFLLTIVLSFQLLGSSAQASDAAERPRAREKFARICDYLLDRDVLGYNRLDRAMHGYRDHVFTYLIDASVLHTTLLISRLRAVANSRFVKHLKEHNARSLDLQKYSEPMYRDRFFWGAPTPSDQCRFVVNDPHHDCHFLWHDTYLYSISGKLKKFKAYSEVSVDKQTGLVIGVYKDFEI